MFDGVAFIEKLLNFLEEGVQNPASILEYLQGRGKCLEGDCKIRGCERLLHYFYDTTPWNNDSLNEFFIFKSRSIKSKIRKENKNAIYGAYI